MKIESSIKSVGSGAGVKGAQQPRSGAAPAAPAAPAPASARDSVEITSLSAQLHALESKLNDVSVVDVARVNAIKQAIGEGRFVVNSEVVADRLLATVKELVLKQQG